MAVQKKSMIRSGIGAITSLIGIVLLVLAVLRWREIEWPAMLWLIAFFVQTAIRAPYSIRNAKNTISTSQKDAVEVALLMGMFATMMVLPLLYLGLGVFAFADYGLPEWAAAVGAALMAISLWIFWRSHADLGRNWSPGLEVRDGHELVTNGIYARIRHPMYAAIWGAAAAQPLLVQNWIAGFLVLPAFALMWFIRVPKEEAMMRRQFGSAYDAYCGRAGRLFPKGFA